MIKTAWAFLVRDFLVAVSYRMAFALQLLTMIVSVFLFFHMGLAVGNSSEILKTYGGSYFAFLLIGMAFVDYMTNSLQTFATSIREGQMVGTLEMLLVSPVALPVIILCASLWSYLFSSLRLILILIISVSFFGLNLQNANFSGAFYILLLSIVYLMGLGILLAGLVLIMKQERAITTVMVFSSLLLGGVVYPVEVLPSWLRVLSNFLPFTHTISGLRKALLLGFSWPQLSSEMAILAGYSLVLFPLGLAVFAFCVNRVKVYGTLSHY